MNAADDVMPMDENNSPVNQPAVAIKVPPINSSGIRRALRKKFISDSLLLFLGCATGVFGFCWFRIWVVGNLDTRKFRQIIDLLPDDWRNFASVDFDWLVSYIGRTSLTLDEPTLISFICLWVLVRGSDVVSGEVNRGTMELLAAQPVSRRRLYFSHAWMTLAGLFFLISLTWLGMAIGVWTTSVEESIYPVIRIPLVGYEIPLTFLEPRTENVPMVSEVNPLAFFAGIINLLCIGFFLAGLAAMCSAMDRYRWRTLGILAAIYFTGGLLKMLAMAKEEFEWVNFINFFGYYHPASAIVLCQDNAWTFFSLTQETSKGWQLAPVMNCAVLIAGGVVFYLIGYRVFERRDIPAPL